MIAEGTPRLTWTTDEVASMLGVARSTVHVLIRDGRLQAITVGARCVRILRTEFDEFLAREGRS